MKRFSSAAMSALTCLIFVAPCHPQDAVVSTDIPASTDLVAATDAATLDWEIAKWEDDIRELETLDETQPDPPAAVLFVGSSSIRLWQTIDRDMAPYRSIRRGYGGSKYSDVAHYARRLITPHQYHALVLFVGNDVSGGESDHTPDQVQTWVQQILEVSHSHRPGAPILIVEVTPTPKRFDAWPKIRQLNARLREIALTRPDTYFVSTADHYLDRNNVPRQDLFGEDRLHQNEAGYQLWSSLIRRRLDEVFGQLATSP